MDYLLFRLYGPLASWGEIAVGEVRRSAIYPSKSTLLGLLAAALGIARIEEDKQEKLARAYRFAVKLLSAGSLMRDYHTTQVPGKGLYYTRQDELHGNKIGTILSEREYRSDFHALVCLFAVESAPWSLDALREALCKPKYILYLGRKANPMAAPLNPQKRQAQGFRQALDEYEPGSIIAEDIEKRYLPPDTVTHYYWEGSMDDFSKEDEAFKRDKVQVLSRRDQPVSRPRWQFQRRQENLWLKAQETDETNEKGS